MRPKILGQRLGCSKRLIEEARVAIRHRLEDQIAETVKDWPGYVVLKSPVTQQWGRHGDDDEAELDHRAVVMEFGWRAITPTSTIIRPSFCGGGLILAKFNGDTLEQARVVLPRPQSELKDDDATGTVEFYSHPEWTHWMLIPPGPIAMDVLRCAWTLERVADEFNGDVTKGSSE